MYVIEMYIMLSNIQNGEPAYLCMNLSVPAGGLEVALCKLTYYHQWFNSSQISGVHHTGWVLQCLGAKREDIWTPWCRTPFACTNRSLAVVYKEAFNPEQMAGRSNWVFSKCIRTRYNIDCRRAEWACRPLGILRLPSWDKYYRKPVQQMPLYPPKMPSSRERKMQRQPDGDIPCFTV